ncbi:hypothetical protein F2Q70_00017614 [Brassica cretica]|uniref:Uncharacterized protein n=1 Tax=Brassica cretica TaxID=69181 RepID=A0A8S9KQP8_BRACR|nr:hypothetical protein F2Q70_00017614 [Brassica cretica]KAF2595758.1 hypothetical protein F2Q68_00010551 [Brassica cretica]
MQIVREEEGWPDSTSYGQESLKERGEKGEGQTPLSMAWTALQANAVQKSVSWEFKGRDERPLHGSYHYFHVSVSCGAVKAKYGMALEDHML